MNVTAMPTHDERCSREATKDVIFLFQKRLVYYIAEPAGCIHDGEGYSRVLDGDGNPLDPSDQPYLTDDEMLELECAVERWETEGVWLDREEAEEWGANHAYRFGAGREGKDWRVYGVPSYGMLAELLRSQTQTVSP